MVLSQTHLLYSLPYFEALYEGILISNVVWMALTVKWGVGVPALLPRHQVKTKQQSVAWENMHLEQMCSEVKKRRKQN